MTITRYWPFGPHTSTGNHLSGITAQWEALNGAGVPAFHKAVDSYGPIFELMHIGDRFGVDNVCVFRLNSTGPGGFDVPNWYITPEMAAAQHVDKTLAHLPQEFDKRVWLEVINEPDKDEDSQRPTWTPKQFADWLGRFAQEATRLLRFYGYRVAMFGFSAGEPEIPDWETNGMLGFLEMAAEDPENIAVALHEYSYNPDSLENASNPYPWQIGRFTELFKICDVRRIARPTVLITEFGWTLWEVPSPEIALPQLEWAANIYASYPQVLGVAIWHFGTGFNNIKYKAWKLLAPMAEKALTWRMEISGETPIEPTEGETFESAIWEESFNHQTVSLMPEAALQKALFADGFIPVGSEYRQTFGGIQYACQVAEHLGYNERRVYWAVVGQWNDVFFLFSDSEPPPIDPPTPPIEPPPAEGVGYDLSLYFQPTTQYGAVYEIKDPDGAQRRVQHQLHGDKLYITKGTGGLNGKSEYEVLYVDDHYIWRGLDTSPGWLNGRARYYDQREAGYTMARWCKRFMKVGETFTGPGHHVQFYYKDNCELSGLNSGSATNVTTLFAHYESMFFNGIKINDVVLLGRSDGERFWFAKGIGMVGWKSGWNESFLSELHSPGSRPNNEMEVIPCL